jgi:NADPH-dependent curcumin reductase CurA
MPTNRRIVLQQRPVGPIDQNTFRLEEEELAPLEEGEARAKVLYVSLDPAMRGWLNEGDTYVPAVKIGEVMRASGVAEVVESRNDRFPVGAHVTALTGWQDYVTIGSANPARVAPTGVSPQSIVGILGTTGLTAYFGLFDLGQPKEGETVLVSGAAGATGSVAGQLAKITGCRVVGTAGGPEKCAWLVDELGFDAAIDYKSEDLRRRIRETCPDGIDVFFDNVGGEVLEAALDNINLRARVVLCGGISSYNDTDPQPGPRNYMQLVLKRSRMEGFIVLDYARRFPEALEKLSTWMAEGKLHERNHVVDGLERAPEALTMLFAGANTGKMMVKVAPDA